MTKNLIANSMYKLYSALSYCMIGLQILFTVLIFFTRDEVPLHWTLTGKIDSVGASWHVVWLLLGSVVCFATMSFLANRPKYFNFPREFSDKEKANGLMRDLLLSLTTVILLFITYAFIATYYATEMNPFVLSGMAILFVADCWYYISKLCSA